MYADIENSVYLIRKQNEVIGSSCAYQNPFHYLDPYGGTDSVAYFPRLTKNKTVTFELWIKGELKVTKAGIAKTESYNPQPLVWPAPSSKAAFFFGAAEYEWLNDTFFYWYNDPADVGYAPCYTGPISGEGVGMLTGYSKAVSDGGKDFFCPPWMREFVFVGVPPFHNLIGAEADARFSNALGGPISEICAAPFERNLNIDLWVSQGIVGNYQRYADNDFYSFYLPEIKEAINNIGNQEITQAFLATVEGADICFPICIS